MKMGIERGWRIRSLFDRLADQTPEDAMKVLHAECTDDGPLRDEVLDLLKHFWSSTSHGGIDLSAGVGPAADTAVPVSPPRPEHVASYRILDLLGEGGFGIVYLAEQAHPKRNVALKILRAAAALSRGRLGDEAQALARLQHPGIAQIYEAGTTDLGGIRTPFIAMEYVDGMPLVQYAREHGLGWRQKIEMVILLCDAVHHAHQRGIIHRDLKPANILVDERAQPRILDFGIAKLNNADVQAATMSVPERQLVGTIPYMSPEQASASVGEIDTRTDVYALGVVCYELLAGRLPYAASPTDVFEVLRAIREEDPLPLADLPRSVLADAQTILNKALSKDKEHRYRSAAEFGADLQRLLNSEPILARPTTALYRARRFTRRNRVLVGSLAAMFVVLMAGLAGTTYGLMQAVEAAARENAQRRFAQENERRAIEEAQRAEREAERAQAAETDAQRRADELELVAQFQASQLANIETAQMGMRLRDNISNKRRAALAAADHDQEQIASALAELDESLAGVNFTNVALEMLEENIFDRALNVIDEKFSEQPLIRARLLHTLAATLAELGNIDRAMLLQKEALALHREHLGDAHSDTFASSHNMGVLLRLKGRFEEALELQRTALDGRRQQLGDEHLDTIASINDMGELLQTMGQHDSAIAHFRDALRFRRTRLGDKHEDTLRTIVGLAVSLHGKGEFEEAEAHYREALEGFLALTGDVNPLAVAAMNNLGLLLARQGRLEEADAHYLSVIAHVRHLLGDLHSHTLTSLNNYGVMLYYSDEFEKAEPFFRESAQGRRRVLGDEHPDTVGSFGSLARTLLSLGALRRREGRLAEAADLVREGIHLARKVLPEGDSQLPNLERPFVAMLIHLGRSLANDGRFANAERVLLEAYTVATTQLGEQESADEASKQLADLYSAWHDSEPQGGHHAKAAEWQARAQAASENNTSTDRQ